MSANSCQPPFSVSEYARLIFMKRRKKPIWLLIGGLLSLIILTYLIVFLSPNSQFSLAPQSLLDPRSLSEGGAKVGILPFFFILIFTSFFSVSSFLLKDMRRGIFIGLFASTYLLLRFIDLTHIFFLIMLLILFATLEMFFSYKK